MKKSIIVSALAGALAISSYGQATIAVNNLSNTGVQNGNGGQAFNTGAGSGDPVYSSLVTSNGLIFTTDLAAQAGNNGYGSADSKMVGVDFSWVLMGGTTAGSVTSVLASDTGANISGDNINWGGFGGPSSVFVPSSTANAIVYLELFAWVGNSFLTYQSALTGGGYVGDSGVFANAAGGGPNPAVSLLNMPDMLLQQTPEPGTMALAGLGSLSLFLFRRKK